jgi:hypothetical protein
MATMPWEDYQTKPDVSKTESAPWEDFAKPDTQPAPPAQEQTFADSLLGDWQKRYEKMKTGGGFKTPAAQSIYNVGQIAGGVGDVAGRAIAAVTPDYVKEGLGKAAGEWVEERKPIVAPIVKGYQTLKENFPETIGGIEKGAETAGNILSLAPMGKPAKTVTTWEQRSNLGNKLFPTAKKRAGDTIAAATGDSSFFPLNARETAIIEKEIPGFKASIGEASNDPGLIKLQRALTDKPGEAAGIALERKAKNLTAIKDYLAKNFPGKQGIDDVIKQIKYRQQEIENLVSKTTTDLQSRKGELKPVDTQTTGANIREAIEKKRTTAKTTVEDQYKALPNEPITNKNTSTAIEELEKGFNAGDESVYPSKAIKRVNDALTPKGVILGTDGQIIQGAKKGTIDFQDLHSLRKDIGRQMWDATRTGNREMALKLGKIQSAIDADIEASMGANNEYVSARNAYADYAKKFRSGATGTVMGKGKQFTGLSTPEGAVGGKFATVDGADDLIRAIGKDQAKTVMEGHFANDLLKKGEDITSVQLKSWLNNNRAVLDKYGLRGQFENVATAQQTVDAAQKLQAQYGKSVAAKLLNADPQNMIASAMAGAEGVSARNTGEIMGRLIKQMGGNQDAIAGLKNSFKDFIYEKAESIKKTIAGEKIVKPGDFQKAMAKYQPAMEVLYKDEPKKLKALQNAQNAFEIESRSAAHPFGGSDTVSKATTGIATAKVLGRIVGHFSSTARLANVLAEKGLGWINESSIKEATDLTFRAMYDPELAEILKMAKDNAPRMVVEKRFKTYLAKAALVTGAINRAIPNEPPAQPSPQPAPIQPENKWKQIVKEQ